MDKINDKVTPYLGLHTESLPFPHPHQDYVDASGQTYSNADIDENTWSGLTKH